MNIKTLGTYAVADKRTRREIEQYIYGIDDPQTQKMFWLHFVCGLSYAKTAQTLGGGMGRNCVYNRIHRYKPHQKKHGDSL
jgi:DNA-directed RNA polymerase specialized sigma24 family protein